MQPTIDIITPAGSLVQSHMSMMFLYQIYISTFLGAADDMGWECDIIYELSIGISIHLLAC